MSCWNIGPDCRCREQLVGPRPVLVRPALVNAAAPCKRVPGSGPDRLARLLGRSTGPRLPFTQAPTRPRRTPGRGRIVPRPMCRASAGGPVIGGPSPSRLATPDQGEPRSLKRGRLFDRRWQAIWRQSSELLILEND